jgi:hypothetical protein
MTPKEKAKELFDKMCLAIATETTDFGYYTNVIHAKKCALIAVDEIINCDSFFKTLEDTKAFTKYWYEVKSETEKL